VPPPFQCPGWHLWLTAKHVTVLWGGGGIRVRVAGGARAGWHGGATGAVDLGAEHMFETEKMAGRGCNREFDHNESANVK
jgi:hypothetical protein